MIFGVGTDIVAVARLGKLYERHGERALGKLLAPAERGLTAHLSISDEQDFALAFVVLEHV